MQQLTSSSIGSYFMDAWNAKEAIICSLVTAIVLIVLYTHLMSAYSEQLAWFCIALT
jgi:hypothetical protein